MKNLDGIPEIVRLFVDETLKRMSASSAEEIFRTQESVFYKCSQSASDEIKAQRTLTKGAFYGQCLDYLNNK